MSDQILNTQVLRADERLNDIDWPSLQKIDVLRVDPGDCILVCAGFEDRAVEALSRVYQSDRTGISIGVIKYLPSYQENRLEKILQLIQESKFSVDEFYYDRENPAGIGEKLCAYAKNFNRVFIDISGMSRLLIVQTLVALLLENRPITIIYSEAETYPPSKKQFYEDQDANSTALISYLSSGIFEVAVTPELSSVSMSGAAIRLVAFPSFDPQQLKNLLLDLQPTYTVIIDGVPPAEENRWRTQAVSDLNLPVLNSFQEPNNYNHDASTLDYRETLNLLLKIYNDRSMFDRIVIAPTGSKMQTVAVGLLRAVLYDIQIVYPTPQVFPKPGEYTKGVRQLYQLDLPDNIMGNNEIDDTNPIIGRRIAE